MITFKERLSIAFLNSIIESKRFDIMVEIKNMEIIHSNPSAEFSKQLEMIKNDLI